MSTDPFRDEITLSDLRPPEGLDTLRHDIPALIQLTGVDAGRTVPLPLGSVIIGRGSDVGLRLEDDAVSRRHCELVSTVGGTTSVRDLGSTNGTRRNGLPVGPDPVPLTEGDRLHVGSGVVFKFTVQHPLEAELQHSLYRSAVRDALTGLFNRRYILDRLEQELAWSVRHRRPLSVAMLDIDHFKRVNDTWGHPAGDRVLQSVASTLLRLVRREDIVGRIGGEEFLVVLREASVESGLVVARRIRGRIATQAVDVGATRLEVTASVGLASTEEPALNSVAALVEAADRRLYTAKNTGRNRVVGPTDPSDTPTNP